MPATTIPSTIPTGPDDAPSKSVSVRLPVALLDDINRRADAVDRSFSWYVRNALQVMVEGLNDRGYPDPLPDTEYGMGAASFTATFAFKMPNFSYPEDHDDTAPSEGRIGTERRIESALAECAHVLRRWGCTEEIVIHSIHHLGGARLPSRITNFPDGTQTVG